MARLEENAGVLKGFMLRRLGAWLPLPNLATRMHCWPSFQTLTFLPISSTAFSVHRPATYPTLPYPTPLHPNSTLPYPPTPPYLTPTSPRGLEDGSRVPGLNTRSLGKLRFNPSSCRGLNHQSKVLEYKIRTPPKKEKKNSIVGNTSGPYSRIA